MNMSKNFTVLGIFAILAAWCGTLHGEVTSRLSSTMLARGEFAQLEIIVADGIPEVDPVIPVIEGINLAYRGGYRRGGRRPEFVYEYDLASYEVGRHVIPPLKVTVDGKEVFTEALDFEIFNPDELKLQEVKIGDRTISYAAAFRTLDKNPFENETIPVEIKLYVPAALEVEDWGIPDFGREGIVAWRFQPSPRQNPVNLLGSNFRAVSYPSTVTATRSGKVAIGSAKIRLTVRDSINNPLRSYQIQFINLEVPKLEYEAKPLPSGAPDGFENAVGDFEISASTGVTEVSEGDPIAVDLIVNGTGNLDTLNPPQLSNDSGWKVYGTTKEQKGDERRLLTGSVVFHQSIRPLELKSEISPYRLVFFDPREEIYKTVVAEAIPLRMRPNTAANAAGIVKTSPVPLERMSDILGVIHPARLLGSSGLPVPGWFWHAIGGLLALILLAKTFALRVAPRMKKDPIRNSRLGEIREISKIPEGDDTGFLKAAGAFAERWFGDKPDPEIQAVLAERDAVCFLSDKPKNVLTRKRRSQILSLLRQAAMVIAFSLVLGISPSRAAEVGTQTANVGTQTAEVDTPTADTSPQATDIGAQAMEAYEAAKYDDAIKLWLGAGKPSELSADTLYNIGNASYRSGSPGHAALYYRRALLVDSSHAEARQNLRFIERKHGAITVQRPDYQYALAKLPLSAWQACLWGGVWMCVLALLVFPATLPSARIRITATAALVIGPLLVSAGILGWRYFPNDAEFAPIARQAVIIGEKVVLHTDAARTSPEVIDAPPGSLCEILRESGQWVYVAFATKTRGWVPVESIEKVAPEKTLSVPKFRKPKAGGKTA